MISITKIFHFEMAHAIHGYPGACRNIHGHSYELHVTVMQEVSTAEYIPGAGLIMDFKDLKKIVTSTIIDKLDHRVVLSHRFLLENPSFFSPENLVTWQVEPTAENMLLFVAKTLKGLMPGAVKLSRIKLFETKDSYAEWTNSNIFKSW